jgi:hypothetical protein
VTPLAAPLSAPLGAPQVSVARATVRAAVSFAAGARPFLALEVLMGRPFAFEFPAGDSVDLKLELLDRDGGPFDVSGCDLSFVLKRTKDTEAVLTKTSADAEVEVVDGDPGNVVTVHILAADVPAAAPFIAALSATSAETDVQTTWAGSATTKPHA